MNATDFEGSNITFGKPADMTDEQCYSIKAQTGKDDSGFPYVLTAWMPNVDDLKALQEGRPLFLKIIGNGMPPVALFTCDAENNGNWD